ncbi:MAG TPA: hypothetical protein VFY85_11975 [Gemmatimonadaceae bacterium]|nr:hypothetical protein [Gemmatimonadaceae bacterium]
MIALALVAQIAVVASAPAAAVSCVPFEVSVAARAPGSVTPRLQFPSAAGVQLLAERVSSRVESFGNGETSSLTEATYTVAVGGAGRVTLPPFVATAGAERGVATAMPIELRRPDDATPRVLVRARLDPGRDSVFVGQQFDYVVDVQLNDVARQRLRRNPTFFPPEMPGVLAYDLALPPPPRRTGTHCFETLSYRRALFPLFAGATTIAPATLAYSLPVSTSFFSREESFELRTDSVRFRAVDPPVAGRPAAYIGAVGRMTATSRLATGSARMGDPVLFTLRLDAVGNVKLLPRPVLSVPWATVALGDERVTVDSTAAEVRGTKEFDWLLTPRRPGRQVVPAVRYPYFDPTRIAYDVVVTDSQPLEIVPAALAASDSEHVAPLPIRRVLREERGAPLTSRGWFWALFALAPAPAAVRRIGRHRHRRVRRRPALHELRSLVSSSRPEARDVRRRFLAALAERVPALPAASVGAPLARVLRRAGVTEPTADEASAVLAQLDAAAYSPARIVSKELASRALAVARAVDAEAVRPASAAATRRPLFVLVALSSLVAGASGLVAMPEPIARAFEQGVSAYQRGDFAAAAQLFGRVSSRAPRAPDAWANFGTASWAKGDTALAVVGWQRALRLDPLDADTRDRLDAVRSASVGEAAYVPPLPVNLLAAASLTLWLAAWVVLALPASRPAPAARHAAIGALAASFIVLLGAVGIERRISPRGLGALRTGRELLDAPSSGSAIATVGAGDVGTLGAREGAWVRVQVDDERAGWAPVASIIPLDDPLH